MNSSGLEKSQHMIILGEDFAQNLQTKSFRCSFCKRGFSNAQALGGHMNIHRKDRAKLREFSDEGLLSLEISTTAAECDEEKSSAHENDRQGRDGDDRAENLNFVEGTVLPRRLPLFEGAVAEEGGGGQRVERGTVELKYGIEVDLELRLGPEPHHHAKSKP